MPFGAVTRRALVLVLVAAAIGLGAGVVAARLVAKRAQDTAIVELRDTARDLRACIEDPSRWVGSGDPAVFAYDGTTYAPSNAAAPRYAGSRTLAIGELSVRSPLTPFGRATIALRVGERGPCAVLQRHWPRRAPPALVQTIGLSAVGVGLVLTLVLGVLWIVRPLVRSIARVAASASEVGRADGYRAPVGLESDDLQHIVNALSSSHARIVAAEKSAAERLNALERHLAEVAHDLRTPLTALQLSIEEALENSEDAPAEAPLTKALEESVYLAGLIENLRLAARVRETGMFGAETWRVDLQEVIERVCSRMRILARRKAMTFEAQLAGEPVLADCSPLAIERALSNVIENAVVHGRRGGLVNVRLTADDRSFELAVEDDGPGLGRAVETSRAGSGLGMRITQQVASAAGWQLATTARKPTGTKVTISGPRATPARPDA